MRFLETFTSSVRCKRHSGSCRAATGGAQDHPVAPDPHVNDAASSMAIVGVMAAAVILRTVSKLWKEHTR